MEAIQVHLQKATVYGRLYPRYDEEARILTMSNTESRQWLYGVDIDGRIIFDIDNEYVLTNLDLLIRKQLWNVDPFLSMPQASQSADLHFTPTTLAHKSFHLPITVTTNKQRTATSIVFRVAGPRAIWVSLSAQCLALVDGQQLCGFFALLK